MSLKPYPVTREYRVDVTMEQYEVFFHNNDYDRDNEPDFLLEDLSGAYAYPTKECYLTFLLAEEDTDKIGSVMDYINKVLDNHIEKLIAKLKGLKNV